MKNTTSLLLSFILIFCSTLSYGQHNHGSCATADLQENSDGFILLCNGGNRNDRTLTYAFENQSKIGIISHQSVQNAFSTWHAATGIGFRKVKINENPDVIIRWVSAQNSYNRWLVGGALAHAVREGDCKTKYGFLIEFDESEHNWSTNFSAGTFDLETVALHEIGHIIGFDHSKNLNSVMFASVGQGKNGRKLEKVDFDGAKFLYPGDFFSASDNIRGWSWNSKNNTASYIVYDPRVKKTKLYIRSYDGKKNYGTNIKIHTFSSSDNIRGWSWDGITASYLAEKNGKTVLYTRSFNGVNFGVHKEIPFSSNDNLRSWSWDGITASYLAEKNGKTVLYTRSFNGVNFGAHKEIPFSSSDNIKAWSWDEENKRCSYFEYRLAGNNSILYKKTFNGVSFGEVEK